MKRSRLTRKIIIKQVELCDLVKRKQSLQDREVYAKSCELDKLVVQYMKICKQGATRRPVFSGTCISGQLIAGCNDDKNTAN